MSGVSVMLFCRKEGSIHGLEFLLINHLFSIFIYNFVKKFHEITIITNMCKKCEKYVMKIVVELIFSYYYTVVGEANETTKTLKVNL